MLSAIQREKFLEISGMEYDGHSTKGEFLTKYPYNDSDWKMSPWLFKFIFDINTKNFYCDLSHRMSNNRMFGWNYFGEKLSKENIETYFPNTDFFVNFSNPKDTD